MADNEGKVARGVFYAFTRVILFVIAILVIALGFYTAMNSMNVNVIAKDAMTKRAQAVLMPASGDEIALGKLFTPNYLDSDAVINTTKYEDYTISNFYQRTQVKARLVWPWSSKVVVSATESIEEIVGALNEGLEAGTTEEPPIESADTSGTEAQIVTKDKAPPVWVGGKYEITLVKDEKTASWMVDKIELVQVIEPTPKPSTSPSGTETASTDASSSATAAVSAVASGTVQPSGEATDAPTE